MVQCPGSIRGRVRIKYTTMGFNVFVAGLTKKQFMAMMDKQIPDGEVVCVSTFFSGINYNHKKGYTMNGMFPLDAFDTDPTMERLQKAKSMTIVIDSLEILPPSARKVVKELQDNGE